MSVIAESLLFEGNPWLIYARFSPSRTEPVPF